MVSFELASGELAARISALRWLASGSLTPNAFETDAIRSARDSSDFAQTLREMMSTRSSWTIRNDVSDMMRPVQVEQVGCELDDRSRVGRKVTVTGFSD